VRQADETVRAREAELVMTRRLVALDAARAFYRLAQAQVAVGAALDIEAGLEELVRYHETRFAEGAVAEGDLIRVQVERERAATSTTLARVEWVRARAELAPYLGGPARGLALDSVRVALSDDSPGVAPLPPLAVLLDSARAARPDLTAARARVAAASAETSLQRALTLRQVGATVGAKQIGDRNTVVIGLSLPIPLFDRNQGEVQRARAERTAAAEELRWAEQKAAAEVEAAYESARLLQEQTTRLRGGFLPRAEETRRIALAAYQEGGIPLLQVLDATRVLADARESYYRALFAARQSLLELNVAAGREPMASFVFGATVSAATTSQESGVRP
jgi:cobalt-zinc-cadmium efflux system outer membrane protein